MKTQMKPMIWLLTLLALLSAPHLASAYYDPGVQRWINRDPLGEKGSRNASQFVANNPPNEMDPLGWWSTGGKSDGTENTIVCDGKGGIRVQLGSKNVPSTPSCILDCIKQHEESHKGDALKENPDICKGKADGTYVLASKSAQAATERKASEAELDCLNRVLTQCPDRDCSVDRVQARINQVTQFHDSFPAH